MKPRYKAHKDINWDRTSAQNRLTTIEQNYKRMHQLVDRLPDALMRYFSTTSYNCDTLYFQVPYDLELMEELDAIVLGLGFRRSYDSDDTKEGRAHTVWYRGEGSSLFGGLEIDINFDPKTQGSKCILIPIEWEEQLVRKIKTYDRICPDGHPELFTQDEAGNLVYVGDNLFPALAQLPNSRTIDR